MVWSLIIGERIRASKLTILALFSPAKKITGYIGSNFIASYQGATIIKLVRVTLAHYNCEYEHDEQPWKDDLCGLLKFAKVELG